MAKRTSKATTHVCTSPATFNMGDAAVVIDTDKRSIGSLWHGKIVAVLHEQHGSVVVCEYDKAAKAGTYPHAKIGVPTLSVPPTKLQPLPIQ